MSYARFVIINISTFVCNGKFAMINASRMILMIAVLIFFLPLLSLAGKVNLPETGQTTCYDEAGNVVTCTDTGQDGDKQAGVAWPSPRFTNPDGTYTYYW